MPIDHLNHNPCRPKRLQSWDRGVSVELRNRPLPADEPKVADQGGAACDSHEA